MLRSFKLSIVFFILGSMLSGCIIWPGWWDDGGHRGGHEHRDGWERR